MDLVAIAYAQDVAGESAGMGKAGEWLFIAIGLFLGVLALFMIFRKFEVSSGHAIVLGVAVGLGCLPYVANFEWTKDGFKFTTKSQGSELAAQLESLTRQEAEIRQNIKDMGEALKAATERVAALERADQSRADGPRTTPTVPSAGKFNPAFFDDLITSNEAALKQNEQRLNEIGTLQQQLQTAQ